MNQEAWLRFLDKLTPRLRDLAQMIMQRVDFIVLSYANRQIDDVQRLERKVDRLTAIVDDLRLKDRAVGD